MSAQNLACWNPDQTFDEVLRAIPVCDGRKLEDDDIASGDPIYRLFDPNVVPMRRVVPIFFDGRL